MNTERERREVKDHRHNLALDTVVEPPVAFDGVDADALQHRQGEDFHTVPVFS